MAPAIPPKKQLFHHFARVAKALAHANRLELLEALAQVERIVRDNFERRDTLTPVRREELFELVRNGEAVVIDVRPSSEFSAGHIPGAINVPLESLPRQLKKLPKGQEIVAYCRGPYCMLAFEAVEQLRKKGFRARRLEDGFPEWKADSLPVDEK
ncbi:MAG: hypothetical protein C0522_09280 [Rhodocyclaceae bacterium]|jgi:rhodanese-related sulfurtransferase|nr:hypothetical protein [Rhodocyclaceae bacterium]